MTNFKADDAYAAAILEDGRVVTCDLSDLAITPTIVAEFVVDGGAYLAFWHDDLNRWEVTGPGDSYQVCGLGDPFWDFCEQTVDAFRDQLLRDNAGNNRLSRMLARDIQAEIDAEIIRDLMIASGSYTTFPQLPQITVIPPLTNGVLTAKWTMETKPDLRKLYETEELVGYSLLKSEVQMKT